MTASNEVLSRRVNDAIDLSKILSMQLRSLSDHGDDDEVRDFLLQQSDASAGERDWLLQFSGGEGHRRSGVELASQLPVSPFSERNDEEKVLDGLIAAYAALTAKRAVFLGVREAAMNTGETTLAQSAMEAATSAAKASAEAWHFLPSRSKIAFNTLTAGEIDPAVETKVAARNV